jgi:hypothetical protein
VVFTYGEPDDVVICIHRQSPTVIGWGDVITPSIGDEYQPLTYGERSIPLTNIATMAISVALTLYVID